MVVTLLNGAPLPDAPYAQPERIGVFLVFSLAIAILCAAFFLLVRYCESLDHPDADLDDKLRIEACERAREDYLQSLIDASPGGRKPWQDRRFTQ